jgi:zinc protease
MMRFFFQNKFATAVLLLTLVGSVFPATSKAADADDPSINDVQEFTVDGLNVLLRESKEAATVSAILYVNGGTSVMSDNELGSSEYFAMKLIPESGSEFTSKAYFRRKMQRLGAGISATDGRDYSAVLMRSTRETFDTTWKFFTEIIVHPRVDQKEFDNLQRNSLLSIQSGRNNPDALTKIVLDSVYFLNHPYGKRLTKENITLQSPENVLHYYKSLMTKSRLLLVVVGSISRSELEKKLRASGITSLPQGNFVLPSIPPPAKAFSPSATYPAIDRKLPTNYVLCYHRIPSKGDSDYYAYVRVRNFMGGFLFQHLRVQSNLSYAPNNEDLDWRNAVEMISFQTPYVDSAVKIFYKDVDFFQNNMILESAIKSGVPKWATSNYMKQETTIEQAGQIGQAQLQTGSWRNAFVPFDKLANVKPEQILRVARTYYKNFNWCVVGDTSVIDKKLLESR